MHNVATTLPSSHYHLPATSGANRRSTFVAHRHALTHSATATRVYASACAHTEPARPDKPLQSLQATKHANRTKRAKQLFYPSNQPVVQASIAQTAIKFIVIGSNTAEGLARLSTQDIQNTAAYSAKSTGISIGTSPGSNSAGFGRQSGNASSTTQSGITGLAGNKTAKTGDAEVGLKPIFDKDKTKADVQAQVQITQEFGKQAPKAAADFAGSQAKDLKTQASQEADPTKRQALLGESAKWEEGGIYRVAMHSVIGGLAGGAGGALGAGSSASAAPLIDQLQSGLQAKLEAAGVPPSVAKASAALVGNATAAGIGAAAGGGSGAAMAFNVDANNRQLHPSERELAKQLASKSGGRYTVEQIEDQMRLMGRKDFGMESNVQPNTVEVLTGSAIANSVAQDPGMPKINAGQTADGKYIMVEVPGKPNTDIQNFISGSTTNVIGMTPYSASRPDLSATTGPAPTAIPTAKCGVTDAACRSGVGVPQSQPVLSAEEINTLRTGIANTADVTGRAAVIVSNASTPAAVIPGPHQPAAAATAAAATVVDFGAKVVEQIARPDVGKGVVDVGATGAGAAAERIPRVGPLIAPVSNELIELWKNSNSSLSLQQWINDQRKK